MADITGKPRGEPTNTLDQGIVEEKIRKLIDNYYREYENIKRFEVVKKIFETAKDYTEAINTKYCGSSLLRYAIEKEDKKVIEALVNHPKIDLDILDDAHGMTAINIATCKNKADIVKILAENKANLEIQDTRGFTPLLSAAKRGNNQIVTTLLKHKANVNATDQHGKTPLHLSSYKGYLNVAATLLQHKADINAQNNYGDMPTALFSAISQGKTNVAMLLILSKAELNLKNNEGNTALMLAAKEDQQQVVEALIGSKADLNTTNNNGETALDQPSYDSGALLAKKGAVTSKAYLDNTNHGTVHTLHIISNPKFSFEKSEDYIAKNLEDLLVAANYLEISSKEKFPMLTSIRIAELAARIYTSGKIQKTNSWPFSDNKKTLVEKLRKIAQNDEFPATLEEEKEEKQQYSLQTYQPVQEEQIQQGETEPINHHLEPGRNETNMPNAPEQEEGQVQIGKPVALIEVNRDGENELQQENEQLKAQLKLALQENRQLRSTNQKLISKIKQLKKQPENKKQEESLPLSLPSIDGMLENNAPKEDQKPKTKLKNTNSQTKPKIEATETLQLN